VRRRQRKRRSLAKLFPRVWSWRARKGMAPVWQSSEQSADSCDVAVAWFAAKGARPFIFVTFPKIRIPQQCVLQNVCLAASAASSSLAASTSSMLWQTSHWRPFSAQHVLHEPNNEPRHENLLRTLRRCAFLLSHAAASSAAAASCRLASRCRQSPAMLACVSGVTKQ
jgi:hypothetical protein